MNSFNDTMTDLYVRTQAKISNPKVQRIASALVAFMIATLFMLMVTMGFAADEGDVQGAIQQGVTEGMSQLYDIMLAILLPVAVVLFAWNAFKVFFGGEKGMESAKKNMLIIVAIVALVYLAPLVVTQIASWFNGQGDGGVFDNALS